MTTTMQTPSNSLKSLKGIFDVPKMNHRRDFLRENKLNLRELQRNTTHKLTQQKQDIEKKQQKHLQRYHKSQEQYASRRSDSQRRYEETDNRRNQHARLAVGGAVVSEATGGGGGPRQNRLSFRRSYSQQRESRENMQPTHPTITFDTYNNHGDSKDIRVPRSASMASVISKAESCDKEIQTEDIIDEDFLYEALKKCSSTEVDFVRKHLREGMHIETNVSKSNVSLHSQPTKYNDDNKSIHSRERVPYDYHDQQDIQDERKLHDQMSQYTTRSQYSQMHNGANQMMATNQRQEEDYDEHLQEHFQNLQIDTQMQREHETHSSGRSRQTMCSNVSKRKSNGNYKLGSRDDVRLPRYLEKEKRDKEEERQRIMAQDPNCPLGYYALSEEERMAALNGAQRKMASLIQELNRMPMTTETLRIRKRKVEIEKELSQLELDVRAFSKPKVYLATEPSLQY